MMCTGKKRYLRVVLCEFSAFSKIKKKIATLRKLLEDFRLILCDNRKKMKTFMR